VKKLVSLVLALLCVLYLLNPGAGIFELIPDHLPLIGNLDEAAAMTLLLVCLRHLGLDLSGIFKPPPPPRQP